MSEPAAGHNYGRKKSVLSPSDKPGGASERVRVGLGVESAIARDFLQHSQWSVREAGSTGNPVGRRVEGITGPSELDALLRVTASTAHSFASFRYAASPDWFVYIVLVLHDHGANAQAMATHASCARSTVYTWLKRGRAIRQNLPNSEGVDDMSVIDTQALSRIELRQQMQGETLDRIAEMLDRIKGRDAARDVGLTDDGGDDE
jgi:hypothetical protein